MHVIRISTCLIAFMTIAALAHGLSAGQPFGGALAEPPNIVPVHAPDVPGGYASTHIIIQVQPETAPRRDGAVWTIDAVDPAMRTPQVLLDSVLIAARFSDWGVTDIRRGIEPANRQLAAELGLDRYYKVRVPQGTDAPAMVEDIGRFEAVIERAELDGIVTISGETIPNDALFGQQWALKNTGQSGGTAGADISATHAWSIYNDAHDESIIVAILDTGVHAEHEDLQGRVIDGWNFIDDNDDPYDVHGHGTHVAGSAAANTGNSVGIAGVSWGARIMPVKVLGDGGGGSWFGIGDGVIFAADNGAHVANMSLSGGFNSYMESAVKYGHQSGMLLVAASGNAGAGNIRYPALYPETIAVGATDRNDNVPSFSSTGPQLNVAAPGVSVLSLDVPTGYRSNSGTSMAAPHVAGLACLLISQDPTRTHEDVWQIIEATADSRGGPGHNSEYGWGRINAATALKWASAIHVPDHYSSIQTAIDAASDGAMIVVAPGVYNEALDFGDKSIHVRSWNKPLSTIIDASDVGTSAVTIAGGQGADATLHGFTITGGSGTMIDGSTHGGGVYIAGSSPTLTGNRFLYNSADQGGAIFADGQSSPGIGTSFFCGNEPINIAGSWQNLGGVTFGQGPCEAVIAPLTDYTVNQGNALTSGLWLLEESDNAYLEIQSVHSSGRHRTSTTVEALSPSSDLTELDLTIETGTTVNGVSTFVDLWNFSSGSWTALDSFSQPQSDTIKEYAISDPNAHIGSDGLIRVRLRTEARMNPNSGGYVFRIDHVQFVVLDEEPGEPEPGPVQQLIDAAGDGDVIVLQPGVYNDAINFNGKAVTLQSVDPDDPDVVAATVINAAGANTSAITMTSGEGPDTVIRGLTITGGTGTDVDGSIRGGGMYNDGASPTVINCVFIANSAGSGGGMANYNASNPHVLNCQFIENTASVGGGMYNLGSSPAVEDCHFLANGAEINGAGMQNSMSSNPEVVNTVFEANSAPHSSGVMNIVSDPTFTNCTFIGNMADSSGGAMRNSDWIDMPGSNVTLIDCVFLENSAGSQGAAIYNTGGSIMSLTSCSFEANVATVGTSIYNAASTAILDNCLFKDNVASGSSAAGIFNVSGGTVTFSSCTFIGNTADRAPALYVLNGSHATIENCIIENNVAIIEFGGIRISEDSTADIAGSFICDNDPDDVSGFFNDLGGNTICVIDEPDPPADPGEPFAAPLLDYEVQIGVPLNAGEFELDWLLAANQQYLFIESRRTQGQHRTNTIIDVDAGASENPISQIDVHTVSGLEVAPNATVTTFIELWHIANGEWVAIASFEQTAVGDHATSTIDVPNPGGYVAGDGTLSVRIRSEAPGNPHQPPYVYRIDHVEVTITPEGD